MTTQPKLFGPFCLDAASRCLWRDEQLVPIRPKPFALLAFLVAHAGEVVTKERLLEAVWPGTVVSEGVLKDYINQIRKTIGDTPHLPQYIATVHRRGYRFIAPVTTVESARAAPPAPSDAAAEAPARTGPVASPASDAVVAREAELSQLLQSSDLAAQGKRQIVLVTGEAGIGKTTLVDAFVAHLGDGWQGLIGRGQCIEQYGTGEAYLPLLEAFGRLGRADDTRLVNILQQTAPELVDAAPDAVAAGRPGHPARTATGHHTRADAAGAGRSGGDCRGR